MKWSFKLGNFAGIDVFIHGTFFLLLAWVALMHWQQGQSIGAVVGGVAFILAIFLCVTLHEYGHALTARRFGVRTKDIILLPIGGVARLERIPNRPFEEFWVALAGPAVNVIIAILLFVWLHLTSSMAPVENLSVAGGPFLERVLMVNVFLVVFNMIPAFPMDGGRVLRSLLSLRLGHVRATQAAASIGQGVAFLFGFVGLLYNPMLLIIAFFVWIGAAQEAGMAQMRSATGGIPVDHAMVTDFRSLHSDDRLSRAVELTLAGSQKDFPVVDQGTIVGVLTQSDLFAALNRAGENASVSSVMQRNFVTVDAFDMLETAFEKLQDCQCKTLPVIRSDKLVGLLTMENVGEFLRIQAVRERQDRKTA
ncbi:MAG: site-2 protease family protein [Desulfobacterales bacterium]